MNYNEMVEVWEHLYQDLAEILSWLINSITITLELLTKTMSRHKNNNSFNIALRELEEEDELQGYDVKNVKRSKKKKVNKMKEYRSWEEDSYWMHHSVTINKLDLFVSVR